MGPATPSSTTDGLAQGCADLADGGPALVEEWESSDEAVDRPLVAADPRRHAGIPEPSAVGFSLVPEHVAAGRDHERRWKAAEILRPARGGERIPTEVAIRHVLVPVPGHLGGGQEVTVSELPVG